MSLIRLLTVAVVFIGLTATTELRADHPNVVVFLADDQGWGDLSVHGNTNLSTPNVDSLAADGALLERFFVCPVCSPTRAEFLTGRFYGRTGVRGVSTGDERLNIDEVTIADTFAAAGYATGAFGKWHNGSQHPYHPNARGFEAYYGFTSGHWGHYFSPMLEHNGRIVQGDGYLVDDLTNRAIDFIESNVDRKKPFLCYLPYNTPHSPMQVPDAFYEKFADIELEMHNRDPSREDMPHLKAALAMCENIDWNVGRVLAALDELGIADDTIVVYFSDNGPNGWRWNGGMKGRKGSLDEGGVRVPMLIRWPGQIEPGTRIEQIAGAIDLLPTLTDLAGIEMTNEKPIDGRSIRPLLEGQSADWPDRYLFSYRGWSRQKPGRQPQISVRNQRYRLDASGQLFDIAADPGQDTNIAAAHPDVVAAMTAARDTFAGEIAGQTGPDDRPFPVGYAEITLLPARDGIPHGNVERSGRAPNCSYFTNWTDAPGDKITWDIVVDHPGRYDVTVYYTCAKEDVGSTVELSFLGERLTKTIEPAHDPPAYGAEADRTPDRGSESYVKDFKPLPFDSIDLPKGRGELTLRALNVPGDRVMEVRLLEFTTTRNGD